MQAKQSISTHASRCTLAAVCVLLATAVTPPAAVLRAQSAAPTVVVAAPAVARPGSSRSDEAVHRAAGAYLVESGAERYGRLSHGVSRRAMAGIIVRQRPALALRRDSVRAVLDASFGWEAYREHAVGQLATRFSEAELQRGTAFYATRGGRWLAAGTAGLDRELATVDAPLDSFAARASTARLRIPISRAELAEAMTFLDSPSGARLLGAERGVWLASAIAARADVERRHPGLSAGRIDPTSGAYSFEIDEPAVPLPDAPSPAYPELLRSANVAGEVLATFVVDVVGRADTTSFQVIRSSHALFTAAVRHVLPEMRFRPAEVLGHKVRQRVSQRFDFALTGR